MNEPSFDDAGGTGITQVEVSSSLLVPLERLCDPANWGYVSESLESMPFPLPINDADALMTGMAIVGAHYRYQHRLSVQAPLAALVSPSFCEMMGVYRDSMARFDLALHSFGVERAQVAIIEPERFRYFDRGDGWSAKFTLTCPGVLLSGRQP